MTCASSEDSDQIGIHPCSLIRIFTVRIKKAWVLSYPLSAQRGLWSDWEMPRLIWVFVGGIGHFVGFIMWRLILFFEILSQESIFSPGINFIPKINFLTGMYKLTSVSTTAHYKKHKPRHDKTNKMFVRPAKTQISLGIRPVWSESSLSAWRKLGSLATRWSHSKNSDQTGRICTLILLLLSCRGSHNLGKFEQEHDKTNQMTCTSSEDLDQPRHPLSLTGVFAVRFWVHKDQTKPQTDSKQKWSDWTHVPPNLSLRWPYRSFCCFCRAPTDLYYAFNRCLVIHLKMIPKLSKFRLCTSRTKEIALVW